MDWKSIVGGMLVTALGTALGTAVVSWGWLRPSPILYIVAGIIVLVGLVVLLRPTLLRWYKHRQSRRDRRRRCEKLQSLMLSQFAETGVAPRSLYGSCFHRCVFSESAPYIVLCGDYVPVFAQSPGPLITVSLWERPQSIGYVETEIWMPPIVEEEKTKGVQRAQERGTGIQNEGKIRTEYNRRATVDIVAERDGKQSLILCQVVVRADNIVSVFIRGEERNADHPFLFEEGQQKIDISKPVKVAVSHSEGATVVRVSGTSVHGTPLRDAWGDTPADTEGMTVVHWPEKVNIELTAASESARPIAFFTKPVCW